MRAALFQSCTGIDPTESASTLREVISAAAADGAEMLFTPEMSGMLDRNRERGAPHLAIEAEDPVLLAVRESAA